MKKIIYAIIPMLAVPLLANCGGSNANEYCVSFETFGGNHINQMRVKANEKISAPSAPTKTGYTFTDWYDNSNYTGQAFNFDTPITKDLTLYAKWGNVKTYTVHFFIDGQESQPLKQTVGYSECITRPDEPYKEGSVFNGWYKSPSYSGTKYAFNEPLTGADPDVNLYGKFDVSQFKVTFVANGGTIAGDDFVDKIAYGSAVPTAKKPSITRAGYNPDEVTWWTTSDFRTGSEFVFGTTKIYKNETVYAKWGEITKYTVKFFEKGTTTPIATQQTVEYNNPVKRPSTPTKEGKYTFEGWHKLPDCSDASYTFSELLNSETMTSDTLTLYGKFDAVELVVAFNGNGGSVTTDHATALYGNPLDISKIPTATRPGYPNATKWSLTPNGADFDFTTPITQSLILYAKWDEIKKYNVHFIVDGDIEHPYLTQTVNYNERIETVADPTTPDGYTFDGWYEQPNYSGNKYAFNTRLTADITEPIKLYGHKVKNIYKVAFNPTPGTMAAGTDFKEVSYGSKIETAPIATRDGYTSSEVTWWYYNESHVYTQFIFGTSETATPVTGDMLLYAKWGNIKTYTINFVLDEEHTVSPQTVDFGGRVVRPADPTKIGYTFDGWYLTDSCTGDKFDFATVINDTYMQSKDSLTLYAKFNPIENLTVKFDPNGGELKDGAPVSKTVKYDETISITDKPQLKDRDGYVMGAVEWYDDRISGTKFDFGTTKVQRSMTLFARWGTITRFNVVVNNGTTSTSEIVEYGKCAHRPADPTSPTTGYHFVGWYKGTTGTTTPFDFNEPLIGEVTGEETTVNVHAEFAPNELRVTFNPNGGSLPVGTQDYKIVNYGDKLTDAPVATHNAYKVFDGWYDKPGNDGATKYDENKSIESSLMLYAHYSDAKTYTVNFLDESGNIVDSQYISYNGRAYRPTDPTKTGHHFVRWYTGSGTEKVTFDFSTTFTGEVYEFNLHPEFAPNTYRVTFNANGGKITSGNDYADVSYGDKILSKPTLASRGAAYKDPDEVKWYTDKDNFDTDHEFVFGSDGTSVDSNLTIYADWGSPKTSTVSFEISGSTSVIDPQTVNYGEHAYRPIDPTVSEGQSFDGWYTDSAYTTKFNFSTPITANTTLYGRVISNKVTVTFNPNGGTIDASEATQEVDYGTQITKPTTLSRSGYDVSKVVWRDETGSIVTFPITATRNMTLSADWGDSNIYAVEFKTILGEQEPVDYITEKIISGEFAYKPADPSKAYHTFDGWYTDSACTAANKFDFTTPITNNITLYGKFIPQQVTVTFNGNGGLWSDGNNHVDVLATVGNSISSDKISEPLREHYTFDGWYTAAEGGTKFEIGSTIVQGPIQLYAHWKGEDLTCTFESVVAKEYQHDETPALETKQFTIEYGTIYNPAKPGDYTINNTPIGIPDDTYEFDYWTDEANQKYDFEQTPVIVGQKFTAHYKKTSQTN